MRSNRTPRSLAARTIRSYSVFREIFLLIISSVVTLWRGKRSGYRSQFNCWAPSCRENSTIATGIPASFNTFAKGRISGYPAAKRPEGDTQRITEGKSSRRASSKAISFSVSLTATGATRYITGIPAERAKRSPAKSGTTPVSSNSSIV